ncbi:XRE family transcriptional regulator, partial [Lacticaseibacillus paracasei subsp. paracasei CNCM I-4648]
TLPDNVTTFQVRSGNATATTIKLNGQSVDILKGNQASYGPSPSRLMQQKARVRKNESSE